jgi:hypothetical protein
LVGDGGADERVAGYGVDVEALCDGGGVRGVEVEVVELRKGGG